MRTPDRGSTTGNASWTDRARSKRAAPTKTPGAFLNNACVGPAGARPMDGPSNGERSESIPPSPPYSKKSSYESASFFFAYCTPGGMRSPDRGSTTGAASWTDHEHSEWAARRASEASQSPLTAIFKEKLVRKYEFFFAFYLPVRQ